MHLTVDLPGARGLFTTRHGGVSTGPYASLNLGPWTDDDPAAVAENRARVAAAAGVRHLLHGRQVHGTAVRRATAPTGAPAEEDGQATALADAAALVLVADCLPVLLASGGAVAALHGGWRGLAGGIVAEGVAALRDLGAEGPVSRRDRARRARLLLRGRRGGPRARSPTSPAPASASATSTCPRSPATGSPRRASTTIHDTGCARSATTRLLLAPARPRRHRAPGGCGVAGLDPARVAENAERVRAGIDAAARRAGRDPAARRAARGGQVRRTSRTSARCSTPA